MAAVVPRSGALLLVSSSVFIGRRPTRSISSLAVPASFCSDEKERGYDVGRRRLLSSFFPPFAATLGRSSTETRRGCSSEAQAQAQAPTETMEAAAPALPPSPSDTIKEVVDALDIRVGRILRAWRHPEADSLYVEEVDVGEPEPRTICSGLVKYIPLDQLQDINVVVLANLKPRNMRGIRSNGMLMAASDASHEVVELLIPPDGSVPGERIWFGAEEEKDKQPDAATPNQVQKKKVWESVQPHLRTTDTCVAVLGVHPMRTSAGLVASKSLKNANIS